MTELNLNEILQNIRSQSNKGQIRITQHAQQEMAAEEIRLDEVLDAIQSGEILENYSEHRRGPCCLLNGTTHTGKPLHIVCTTAQSILIMITVYRPKPPKWLTPTQRRSKNEM